ncbi:unnamed protein product, partial [Heterosigma akashiwo]
REFTFDLCCPENSSQVEVFDKSGMRSLVKAAVDGYAVATLAYGATGAGKTHTMFGPSGGAVVDGDVFGEDPSFEGIVPRCIDFLYELLSQQPSNVSFSVRASHCEVYNEQIFDLLSGKDKPLPVRFNIKRGFYVQGLFELLCRGRADLRAAAAEGVRKRRTSGHARNADSSRSHAMLTVHVQGEWADPDDGHAVSRHGKLTFVDLAGSERLKRSRAADARETGQINKSLMTLGKVISALAAAAQAQAARAA